MRPKVQSLTKFMIKDLKILFKKTKLKMETQQQQSKTIYLVQKVQLVISILILIVCASSISQNKQDDKNDYLLLNTTLKNIRLKKSNAISNLDASNSNEYVIEIIKNLKEFDLLNNKYKLDSLRQSIGLKGKEMNDVFNTKEYDFLISQKAKSVWDFSKINDSKIKPFQKNEMVSNQVKVNISKPIYTLNKKFALVFVSSSWSGIIVYKKQKNDWVEYKLIAAMFH